MDHANLVSSLQASLRELGAFSSTLGLKRLNVAILAAGLMITQKRPMPWSLLTTTLETATGTKGPYDPPTGFKGFPPEERNNRLDLRDLQTSYVIKDTDSQRWEISYDKILGKWYFRTDPGSNTFTIPYFGSYDNDVANVVATISVFPEELFEVFEFLVSYHIMKLNDTNRANAMRDQGMTLLEEYYDNYDMINPLPKTRAPVGLNGLRYDNIARSEPMSQHYTKSNRRA